MCDEDIGTQDCSLAMEVADEDPCEEDTDEAELDDLCALEVKQEDMVNDAKCDPADGLCEQRDAENICTDDDV